MPFGASPVGRQGVVRARRSVLAPNGIFVTPASITSTGCRGQSLDARRRLRGAHGGDVAFVPPPQPLEREDAGVVAVVPRDVEAPCAVKAGVVDAQRRRAVRTGPDDLASLAKSPAHGARAPLPECHQVETGDVLVEERDRDALSSLDKGVRRLESIVHSHSLPRGISGGNVVDGQHGRLGHAVAASHGRRP